MTLENFTLHRQSQDQDGTFGELHDSDGELCVTLELANPIPAGVYICSPHNGSKWKNVWEILKVPGHTDILIHAGNFANIDKISDTEGCVLVGKKITVMDGQKAITESQSTLDYLRRNLPPNFQLTITEEDLIK